MNTLLRGRQYESFAKDADSDSEVETEQLMLPKEEEQEPTRTRMWTVCRCLDCDSVQSSMVLGAITYPTRRAASRYAPSVTQEKEQH